MLFNHGPNIVTFQLVTGGKQFHIIGIYIPPDCTKGADELQVAWDKCPAEWNLFILGIFNINFWFPRTKREEVIVDLLDNINLTDTSLDSELLARPPPIFGGHGATPPMQRDPILQAARLFNGLCREHPTHSGGRVLITAVPPLGSLCDCCEHTGGKEGTV